MLKPKASQSTLQDDVRRFLSNAARPAAATHQTIDADHRRFETRTGLICTGIGWPQQHHQWPGPAARLGAPAS